MGVRIDFKEAISQRFIAERPADFPYVLPNRSTKDVEGQSEYAVLNVVHSTSRQITVAGEGNRRFEKIGHIYVATYTPIDTGSERGDELAEVWESMFEGRALEGFVCRFDNVHTRETGKDPTGRYQTLLTDAFFAYRLKK